MQPQQRPIHVATVVQRLDTGHPLFALAVEVGSVFLLNLGRIAQHDRRQGPRRWGAVDRSIEAVADQMGQVTAVIDVGVAEQHGVDVLGAKGKLLVTLAALGSMALEQPAVQQQRAAAGVNLMH